MELDPRSLLTLLNENLEDGNSGAENCNQLLGSLNAIFTREELSWSCLDLHLYHLFDKSQGLLGFMSKIVNNKSFKSSVKHVYDLIYTLINNFPSKLEKYVLVIHDICFKAIKSCIVDASEKVKAFDVFILSLENINKCLENSIHYSGIYKYLIGSLSNRTCDSVQEKNFKALGVLGKHFQYVVEKPESIRKAFISFLDLQMAQQNYSNKIVDGIFTGLANFSESFPFDSSLKEHQLIIGKLYKYIETLSMVKTDISRVANRAALIFFAQNLSLFVNMVAERFQRWHELLLQWLDLSNSDDQKTAVVVLEAFYRELGEFFKSDGGTNVNNIIAYFLDYFKRRVKYKETSNRERRLCLHGLGCFSSAFHASLNNYEIKDLIMLIMHDFEQTYVLPEQPVTDSLEYLPHYVQTAAKFIHFKAVTNSELFCLQRGVIMMIKTFPQLPLPCHGAVIDSLVSTYYYVAKNDENLFDNFVESTIYQGVVWTCSHQHISESDFSDDNTEAVITVKNYLNLWKGILKIKPVRKYDKIGIFLAEREYLLGKIIDKLIKTVLVLVNKLNVAIVMSSTDGALTDIESTYKVAEVNDYAIFLNLVDFYQEILMQIDPAILEKCISKLVQHFITECVKFPLISGFYKLLSSCLQICNKLNYFEEAKIASSQDINMCHESLCKFVELVLDKTKEFKGDLLIACLYVLLNYPIVIIKIILPACVTPFRTIFEVGRSCIKLVDLGLDTLECWQKQIENEEMESFLAQVIPLLDSFLRSKSLGYNVQSAVSEKRRKTKQIVKKRKVLIEVEPELITLQMKVLNFVGRQSSKLCRTFVHSENNIDLAVWGNKQHLKIILPYQDVKLDIHLDKFLPRIVHLAMYSTDRKTRVVACELLQATMMVFLGTTKQMPQSALSDVNELLKHVSVPLLKLGCDLDQVIEQLFRPLCFEVVHWYTHVTQTRNEHGAIIIEAILESITHPTDTALRDFSGKCLNEYVHWTIKQTSENNLARDPINIKILVKKMRFYSTHPDSFKKLGAALIFNNIYRELREEASLLSIFWIEFLHIFVKSLSSFKTNATDENVIMQINNALTHIERGFVEKANLFNKSNSNRRTPTDLGGNQLKDIAVWLLTHTGSRSSYCRTKCMTMFCNISPRTLKFTTLQGFIEKNVDKENNWVKEAYEKFLKEHENEMSNSWLEALLCALEGYSFVIENKLVAVNLDLLSETMIAAVKFFIEKVHTARSDETSSNGESKKFSALEMQELRKLKSKTILKTFQLFKNILNDEGLRETMTLFYSPTLWTLVVEMVFNQQNLGFEHLIPNEDNDMLIKLLENFLKSLPENCSNELVQFLNNYVLNNKFTEIDLKGQVTLKQRNVVKGLNILQSFDLNRFDYRHLGSGLVANLLKKFIEGSENHTIFVSDLQSTTLNYCLSILDFALNVGNEFTVLIGFLHKPYQVKSTGSRHPIQFGVYVLTLFESSLIKKILENFETFVDASLNFHDTNCTVRLLAYILNYVIMNRRQLRMRTELLTNCISSRWDTFGEYFKENVEDGITFIKYLLPLVKMGVSENEHLRPWLIDTFQCNENMSWKDELDIKIEIFRLLAVVIDDEDSDQLQLSLARFQSKFFSESSSVPLETQIISVDKLLCATSKMRSPILLGFLLETHAKVVTKESNTNLQSVLKTFLSRNTEEVQRATLSTVYSICSNETMNFLEKYRLIINITPLCQHCSFVVFEDFLVAYINNVIASLELPLTKDNLVHKILHFVLIELLFLRCPIQNNSIDTSRITQAAFPQNPNNKQLVLKLLKFTLNAVKDTLDASFDCVELLRLYKCHSYNAMASIISNSLQDNNFYTKLFVRDENNIDILWSSIIDLKKVYEFETDFDEIPKRKKFLVNIRDQMSTQRKLRDDQLRSIKYLESVRVYNSSLSEDVTKFDFNDTVIRSQTIEDNQDVGNDVVQTEIELDCIEINNHECMKTVCGLIEHMVQTGITELPDNEDEEYSLPPWLKGIRALLLNQDTHNNVKIFWIKVIDNIATVFKHFAKYFIEPLLQFIAEKCAGNRLNYFVTDVVAILSSWSVETIPRTDSEIRLAAELISFLINNLTTDRKDMLKYNLELIKTLVEAWKSSFALPYDLIYSKLNVDPNSDRVLAGIHVSSIYLANDIAPWKEGCIGPFCKTLFDILRKNTRQAVYKPCAETIGLMLRFLNGSQYFSKVAENVYKVLNALKDKGKGQEGKHSNIIECLVIHCPDIVDEYQLKVLLNRFFACGKQTPELLRIFLRRSEIVSDIDEFINENWSTYIENDDTVVQLLALEIVYKCLEAFIRSVNLKSIVESVCKLASHSDVLCRTRVYEIGISIYQSKAFEESSDSKEVLSTCKKVLVEGLTDKDVEIRKRVFQFWEMSNELPLQLATRFTFLLNNLYKTNTEYEFLGYTSYLLLDIIKTAEEYDAVLFEHPLEDCDFEAYNLETNWRSRHQSVVPLFAETVRSYSGDWPSMSSSNFNKLRETQSSLEFTPTQSARLQTLTQTTMSQSSLYIGSQEDNTFVNPNFVTLSYKYQVPKRRFLKDKSKIQKSFAYREIDKSRKKEAKRKDLAKEKEHKVTIHRNYRKGDLPDIQITLGDILKPLQALALSDGEVAKILYLEMFKGIFQKMKTETEFLDQISTGIRSIFNSSNQFSRTLFRTLLDVLLLCKNSVVIPPDLVASVCESSGLTVLGILLVEEYLMCINDEPFDSKRTRGSQPVGETSFWMKLAELYKEMDEWDVVNSIFLQKTDCPGGSREALMAESQRHWKDAQDLYKKLIHTDESLDRKDFYYDSYFKCFAHLGEWSDLVKTVDAFTSTSESSSWNNLWDQDWNQRKLLPWYISGHLKMALFNQSASNQFLTNLNNSLKSNHLEHLQNNFSEELCMLYIIRDEVDEADNYQRIYINNFLASWQQLDPLYTSLRYNKLLKLRNVVDIEKFLSALINLNTDCVAQVEDLMNYWNRTEHEVLPSIVFAEERVLYRKQFVNVLKTKVQSFNDADLITLVNDLNQMKIQLDDYLIDTAFEQNNFQMTKKYVTVDNHNSFKHKLGICKLAYVKANMLKDLPSKMNVLLQGCKALAPVFTTELSTLQTMLAHLQRFNHLEIISSLLVDNEELFRDKRVDLVDVLQASVASAEEIGSIGANQLKSFLSICENEINSQMDTDAPNTTAKECTVVGDCYVKLAYFAKAKGSNHFSDFMFSVLRAMKYNSSEGRQLFPCILMEKSFSDDHESRFREETETIPLWMFLGWLPQLLVNISASKVSAVAPLLIKIAETYPQAIMYAYRLSRENFSSETGSTQLVEELDKLLLNDSRIDKFLLALSFVAVPNIKLVYYWRKILIAFQSNNFEQIKSVQQTVDREIYCCKPNSNNVDLLQGNMYSKISKFKEDFKKLASCKSVEIKKHLERIKAELGNVKGESKLLKDYSPWLAGFSADKLNIDLEIPGQYDGQRMPLVQHHVKISGFSPNVSVMDSLRKPVRISILGNDTKEYDFLVKFGEDIRQDQRIQQIFTLMNHIFAKDKNLCGSDISILTYQVVPLTTNLGIIQWIGNSTSLMKFITDFLQATSGTKSVKDLDHIANTYYSWISNSSNQPEVHTYGRAAMKYSRDKTVPKFRSLINLLQWDVLRSALLKISANTEGFFVLRDNFIRSYSVMCASHWILGVGDRHLKNSLICTNSGKILGIDFGHAFGTGTQILPIPETVPFRLTPHIVALMEPLGEKGLFRAIMKHCLNSLRSNAGTLLATMNVFIEEPSLDWLEHASRNSDVSKSGWDSSQKINQAKRKLNGAKSTTIMIEDLKAGHQHNENYMKAYVSLVEGLSTDIRSLKEGDNLSVEDQVDCLIDHATDYNLLGRMYHGWTPWV